MQDDVIQLLTVAIAVSVPQDVVAYEMLQRQYIMEYEQYYRECLQEAREKGESIPTHLDAMIAFAVRELPARVPECQSLLELYSESTKTEIRHRFVEESIASMLTNLAKRETIKANVRQYLHSQDKQNNHAAIDSTRFDTIFTDFMVMFEGSCAASFRFEGDYVAFVMYSFITYYYPSHLRDIWRIFRDIDRAKKEIGTNVSDVRILEETTTDDLQIHDLINNIVAINDMMFSHSGQSEDARGVCYDIYYMITQHLCEERVAQINAELSTFKLQLVDLLDRRENRPGLAENKSIASKISNARELVPYVFDCVRKGNWQLDNMVELRDQCFARGKKDRDGKNCIWKDVQAKAETSRYLDMPMTAHNFKAFNLLFKGVLSVYTLMRAFEARGKNIVESYRNLSKVLFSKDISRHIGGINDLQHVDLIEKLQAEGEAHPTDNHGELLNVREMIHDYAGSEHNNNRHIVTFRYNAQLYGLLDNPQLKQKGSFQTPFSQLKSAAEFMTAIPLGYGQYIRNLAMVYNAPQCIAPMAILDPADVVKAKYSEPYFNRFLIADPQKAAYYLNNVLQGKEVIMSWQWSIGTGEMPCLLLQQIETDGQNPYIAEYYGLYVGMADTFMMIPIKEIGEGVLKLPSKTFYELQREIASSTYNGRQNSYAQVSYSAVPKYALNSFIRGGVSRGIDYRDNALLNSMCFDTLLGFENLLTSDVQSSLKAIKMYPKYRSSAERYIQWVGELSLLQHSFVELMQVMYSYGLFLALSNSGVANRVEERNGRLLVESLLRTEFSEENLNWFFKRLQEVQAAGTVQKLNFKWSFAPLTSVQFVPTDLSCLGIIWGNDLPACGQDSLTNDLIEALKDVHGPAKRFVQMYNFMQARLNFLRLLRDAYDLTFNIISMNLSTMGCEFNSQFNIVATLEGSRNTLGTGGMMDIKCALLDTLSIEDTTRFVDDVRLSNWQNFSVLCEGLVEYFDSCCQEISGLVDYEVTKSDEMQSEFQNYGGLFHAIGPYSDRLVIDLLRDIHPRSRVDSAGFFLMKNSYLRGRLGSSEYYIHSTGRVLEATNGRYSPKEFDFSKEQDCVLYEDIIRDARTRNVW